MKANSNSEFKRSTFQIIPFSKAGLILFSLLKDAINMGTHDEASASRHGSCTMKEHIPPQSKFPHFIMLCAPSNMDLPLIILSTVSSEKSFSVKTYHLPPLYFTEYSLHIQLLMATRLFSEDTLPLHVHPSKSTYLPTCSALQSHKVR